MFQTTYQYIFDMICMTKPWISTEKAPNFMRWQLSSVQLPKWPPLQDRCLLHRLLASLATKCGHIGAK